MIISYLLVPVHVCFCAILSLYLIPVPVIVQTPPTEHAPLPAPVYARVPVHSTHYVKA